MKRRAKDGTFLRKKDDPWDFEGPYDIQPLKLDRGRKKKRSERRLPDG